MDGILSKSYPNLLLSFLTNSCVDHHYKVECVGTFNEEDFMSIDLVKYEQELKSKFGSSFINSVYVEKNTV